MIQESPLSEGAHLLGSLRGGAFGLTPLGISGGAITSSVLRSSLHRRQPDLLEVLQLAT